MDGVLVLNKPSGITSARAVAIVKRKLKAKKVGHLGTLDPMATGVLPLVINKATKLADILSSGEKEYIAVLKLGITTDTFDMEGDIKEEKEVKDITEELIKEKVSLFVGNIKQMPPMFSAKKVKGVPLYKHARKGVEIKREEKEVFVSSIEILKIEMPEIKIKVNCSKGTFIRSICHDLGQLLNTGATMTSLVRTKNGEFNIEESCELDVEADVMESKIVDIESLNIKKAVND